MQRTVLPCHNGKQQMTYGLLVIHMQLVSSHSFKVYVFYFQDI
jgi:hypothetical protein